MEDFCSNIMDDDYSFDLSEDTFSKIKEIIPNEKFYNKMDLLFKINSIVPPKYSCEIDELLSRIKSIRLTLIRDCKENFSNKEIDEYPCSYLDCHEENNEEEDDDKELNPWRNVEKANVIHDYVTNNLFTIEIPFLFGVKLSNDIQKVSYDTACVIIELNLQSDKYFEIMSGLVSHINDKDVDNNKKIFLKIYNFNGEIIAEHVFSGVIINDIYEDEFDYSDLGTHKATVIFSYNKHDLKGVEKEDVTTNKEENNTQK